MILLDVIWDWMVCQRTEKIMWPSFCHFVAKSAHKHLSEQMWGEPSRLSFLSIISVDEPVHNLDMRPFLMLKGNYATRSACGFDVRKAVELGFTNPEPWRKNATADSTLSIFDASLSGFIQNFIDCRICVAPLAL
jgi:hypothetical protein